MTRQLKTENKEKSILFFILYKKFKLIVNGIDKKCRESILVKQHVKIKTTFK